MKNDLSGFTHKMLSCTVGDIIFKGIFDSVAFEVQRLTYDPHMHVEYEVHVVSQGVLVMENLDGTAKVHLQEGQMALIPPNYYHNTVNEGGLLPEKYSFRIDISKGNPGADFCERLFDLFTARLRERSGDINVITISGAVEYVREISCGLSVGQVGGISRAEAYYKLFITELVINFLEMDVIKSDKKNLENDTAMVRKAKIDDFIFANYDNSDLVVNMLADRINLSIRQVNRIVLQFYGKTFSQLLAEIRMNRAQRMLLRSNMSAKEIAGLVGYKTPTGFFVAFKKRYGVTPKEFRTKKRLE